MNTIFPEHAIIAQILQKKNELPCDEWVSQVKKPLKPFFEELNTRILSTSGNLTKVSLYNKPGKENKRQRQCLMRARWNYDYIKLFPQAKTLSIIVQLSDYEGDRINKIFWGLNWWGSRENSKPVRELFEKVKGTSELIQIDKSMGASVTAFIVVPQKYTASEVLSLPKDIKETIVGDLSKLIWKLDSIQE